MIEKVFAAYLITDDIDRAPDDSEVHFERFEQEHSLAQGLEPRDGRQGGSLLGCLMGCTRELRVGFINRISLKLNCYSLNLMLK